jgi:hypothetical protein
MPFEKVLGGQFETTPELGVCCSFLFNYFDEFEPFIVLQFDSS